MASSSSMKTTVPTVLSLELEKVVVGGVGVASIDLWRLGLMSMGYEEGGERDPPHFCAP